MDVEVGGRKQQLKRISANTVAYDGSLCRVGLLACPRAEGALTRAYSTVTLFARLRG